MTQINGSGFNNNVYFGQIKKQSETKSSYLNFKAVEDSVSFSKTDKHKPVITTERMGSALNVSFCGTMKNPMPMETRTDAIQMKVRGVAAHQKGTAGAGPRAFDDNVVKLAQSQWKDGQKLDFRFTTDKQGNEKIQLGVPELGGVKKGGIGRVPDELVPDLKNLMKGREKDFRFELSNVISGNSKGAPTIGLRANLLYVGKDQKLKQETQKVFTSFMDSKDPNISKQVMMYQEPTSPDQVLGRIFDIEAEVNGPKAVEEIKGAIKNISEEINNPDNKRILIVGHCKPDGDTLGCVIGMKTAIKGAYPDKEIDCAVDDKIPGLFRAKMPGVEDVKRPYNPERIALVENSIAKMEAGEQTAATRSQIQILKNELADLKDPSRLFDDAPLKGEDRKKYDLVILLDIPTPKRFSGGFKDYIENSTKQIYIDHHPHKINEWIDAKETTGVDMEKIHKNNLALVSDMVPAATQLVTIVADKAGILGNTMKNSFEEARKFVASVITGTSTDTGSFTRTANLLPEHMEMSVKDRPNFAPEGMSKWLIDEVNANQTEKVDKKWLRDNIVFDVPDKTIDTQSTDGELSPRDKMLDFAVKGKKVYPDAGVGIVSVSYDQMCEVWEDSLKHDPEFTLLDVQNGFKYCEVMGALKSDPTKVNAQSNPKDSELQRQAKEMYSSPYDADKIAILAVQDKKAGYVTENSEVASMNGIRLSFRSADCSDHAELLASIFDGGGHGGASGGRIDLPGVEIDSKLVVMIDGKPEFDAKKVLNMARHNLDVLHDNNLTPEQKREQMHEVKVAINENGKEFSDLVADIVTQIRATQPKPQQNEQTQVFYRK
ncbi:MAG: DHH family phosphoesterase [Candidatus Gastranaerophilales bacterium]|nr:DHH family phosphoesterase [Candidatus Gastranaerophilales bacterium]